MKSIVYIVISQTAGHLCLYTATSTTIVSGAIAERTNLSFYTLFSLLNSLVYCVPAGWLWGNHGFLRRRGRCKPHRPWLLAENLDLLYFWVISSQ